MDRKIVSGGEYAKNIYSAVYEKGWRAVATKEAVKLETLLDAIPGVHIGSCIDRP